jgi:hypothetical protein
MQSERLSRRLPPIRLSALLKNYRISRVTSDRYAGLWVPERFRAHGIECSQAAKPKSDLYRDFLPILNSGGVELLDNPRLKMQLIGLERRTARGGRDSIDHAPGANDDVANAVAGAVVGSAMSQGGAEGWIEFYRRLNEEVAAPPPGDLVRVVVPADQWPSTIIGISGANYLVYGLGEDRFLMMSSDDARAFIYSPTLPSSWREFNPCF